MACQVDPLNVTPTGICDLVLLRANDFADGLGLNIHIRTKERYGYSFIESAAIQIGKDVVEIGSYGDYFFNGVQGAATPISMADRFLLSYKQEPGSRALFIARVSCRAARSVNF